MSENTHFSKLKILIGPTLLTVAHLFLLIALRSFGARAGGYPLSRAGLGLYSLAVALSLIGLLVEAIQGKVAYPRSLLTISAPAFASFLFWLGLSAGGAYPAYHPHAVDHHQAFYWSPEFIHVTFAILFSSAAILYGSLSYLVIAWTAQFIPPLAVDVLAAPINRSIGTLPRPPLLGLITCYLVSAFILLKRNRVLKSKMPGLGWGCGLMNASGATCLWRLLSKLPSNGVDLSEVSRGLHVPPDAWTWMRSAAEVSAYATVAVLVALGFQFLSEIRGDTEPTSPLQQPWRLR